MSSISSELLCVLEARIWYKQGEEKNLFGIWF